MTMTAWSADTSERCSRSHALKAGAGGRTGLYRRTIWWNIESRRAQPMLWREFGSAKI
jgi:hypothetical protein